MNDQFPRDEEELNAEIQSSLIRYKSFLQHVLEGKDISHASVKKQIGRLVSDLIDDYVAHSCVFHLEIPREVYRSIISNIHAAYPRTLPVILLDYIKKTPLAANLSKLLEDRDHMFYALVCYYFWQDISSRYRNYSFNSSEETVNPYLLIPSSNMDFDPMKFDVVDLPQMMNQLREATGKLYTADKSEGRKKGRVDLGGRSNKDMELVIFKEKIKDQPELVEFAALVVEAARDRKVLVTPDFIVNLSLHKYPKYIPFPILQSLKKSKSERLKQLVQKHYQLFAAICWKILNVISNSEFLFKYGASESDLYYAIASEEYEELSGYSGWRFKEGTYLGEQYIHSGVLQVFGIDLSISRKEIDLSVYADPEDLEDDSDYEP